MKLKLLYSLEFEADLYKTSHFCYTRCGKFISKRVLQFNLSRIVLLAKTFTNQLQNVMHFIQKTENYRKSKRENGSPAFGTCSAPVPLLRFPALTTGYMALTRFPALTTGCMALTRFPALTTGCKALTRFPALGIECF